MELRRALSLGGILGLLWVFQALSRVLGAGDLGGELTLLLGFLLLAAFLAGKVAEGVRLPRITGYLLLGWIVGPDLLGFLDRPHLEGFRIVEDLAISLIAMSAGGELRIGALRRRWRQIVGITAAEMTAVFLTLSLAVVAVSGWFPLTAGMPTARILTVAMIFGSIAIANSPAVAIAVINETGARGPVSSTILAVTVLKDVMVVVLFTGALSVARVLEGAAERAPGVGWTLGWEVGGSLAMGMVAGWMISLYMVRFKGYSVLFILGAALANTLLATFFHLEALLISISAGFFVRNLGA
ncbi:MAG: cation:proton antiporter, partial [Longimicrobiales bacterium]|nr:cation:proton antiporter [Longimicrobiales bacterium]